MREYPLFTEENPTWVTCEMLAMMLSQSPGRLEAMQIEIPTPGSAEVLVRVSACAICRTDLHVVDGELPHPKLPLIPGHEIVGRVVSKGADVQSFRIGDRVGIPWLGYTCGACPFCRAGQENLCDAARFTGYQLDGGYAEYAVADHRFCFALSDSYSDSEAAPLLCAGLIGYRALKMTGDARNLGIYGFGAAAHVITQVARHQNRHVFAFTREGDAESQRFALQLGAVWAGHSAQRPPRALDAAIIFAPVGSLVPQSLAVTRKGGMVVCAGIHMSPIPEFPYELLWGERSVRSVANLTRKDAIEFLSLAPQIPVDTHVATFPLTEANRAMSLLRSGAINGAAVLVCDASQP